MCSVNARFGRTRQQVQQENFNALAARQLEKVLAEEMLMDEEEMEQEEAGIEARSDWAPHQSSSVKEDEDEEEDEEDKLENSVTWVEITGFKVRKNNIILRM